MNKREFFMTLFDCMVFFIILLIVFTLGYCARGESTHESQPFTMQKVGE